MSNQDCGLESHSKGDSMKGSIRCLRTEIPQAAQRGQKKSYNHRGTQKIRLDSQAFGFLGLCLTVLFVRN